MTSLIVKRTLTAFLGLAVSLSGHAATAETAAAPDMIHPLDLKPLDTLKECAVCPEMIVMPSGSFMMGALPTDSRNPFDFYGENPGLRKRGPDELNIIPSEHPRHLVEMDIRYAIARNEVSYAEWIACVEDGGCRHSPDHRVLTPTGYVSLGPDHPAINVSYLDTLEYVAWLNRKVGAEAYRLPTEAEWEYAARAGTDTPFAQGEELSADQANFSRKATENLLEVSPPDLVDRYMPVTVNELDAANQWGVRHMSGNVSELTLSCWSAQHLGLTSDSAYLAHAEAARPCTRVAKGGDFGTAMTGFALQPAIDRPRTSGGIILGSALFGNLTSR